MRSIIMKNSWWMLCILRHLPVCIFLVYSALVVYFGYTHSLVYLLIAGIDSVRSFVVLVVDKLVCSMGKTAVIFCTLQLFASASGFSFAKYFNYEVLAYSFAIWISMIFFFVDFVQKSKNA